MKKRLLALLLALAMGLSLAACSAPAAEEPSPSVSTDTESTLQVDLTQDVLTYAAGDLSNGEALITINGQEVSNSLFLYWLAYASSYYESMLYYYGMTVADYASVILEESCTLATYYMILSQKAQELGCILTDDQQAAIDAEMDKGSETYERITALYGLTDEDMLLIYSLTDYYDNLMAMLVSDPSEEELNNFVYQTKHILISTATEGSDGTVTLTTGGTPTNLDGSEFTGTAEEYNAVALAKAQAILEQINASDDPIATFDALMNEHSQDGRDENGDLAAPDGYVASVSATDTTSQMVTEYETAALALEVGQISDPVLSPYGYHIILRGEVENIEDYAEDCAIYLMDTIVTQWLSEAVVEHSESLETLDVAEFYERVVVWQTAYLEANPVEE